MSKANSRSILVVDSGVGGLSVCQSILAMNLGVNIIYFADDAYFPYGLMPEGDLLLRLNQVVGEMVSRHQPDLVVLACNTVSTLVLPELRAKYDVPFVGVVPAIKPAAKKSITKRIGLLATPATVKRSYTDELINDFASDCEVVRVGSNDLVLQAESLLAGKGVSTDALFSIVQPFLTTYGKEPIDTVVLGCTHFPLLKQELSKLMPNVEFVDSGEAIARRVKSLIGEGLQGVEKSEHLIYFSKKHPELEAFSTALRNLGFNNTTITSLEV